MLQPYCIRLKDDPKMTVVGSKKCCVIGVVQQKRVGGAELLPAVAQGNNKQFSDYTIQAVELGMSFIANNWHQNHIFEYI